MMQGHMGTVAIVIEKLRDGGNGDCSDYSLATIQTTPGPSSLGLPFAAKGTQELRRGIEAGEVERQMKRMKHETVWIMRT